MSVTCPWICCGLHCRWQITWHHCMALPTHSTCFISVLVTRNLQFDTGNLLQKKPKSKERRKSNLAKCVQHPVDLSTSTFFHPEQLSVLSRPVIFSSRTRQVVGWVLLLPVTLCRCWEHNRATLGCATSSPSTPLYHWRWCETQTARSIDTCLCCQRLDSFKLRDSVTALKLMPAVLPVHFFAAFNIVIRIPRLVSTDIKMLLWNLGFVFFRWAY